MRYHQDAAVIQIYVNFFANHDISILVLFCCLAEIAVYDRELVKVSLDTTVVFLCWWG